MSISVCMATYNGERFIHEQLDSILGQLGIGDELIIVDDASSDRTVKIIESYLDARIRLLQQPQNMGVLSSFGLALGEARHDIVFLSDQDDVWRFDKVAKFTRLFSSRPDISLILSDCFIIDAVGSVISSTRFRSRQFRPGAFRNILRNNYLGCSMAFRRSILRNCLPFPSDTPMHDMWIGIVNDVFGRTAFIDEPLMSYRRHDRNVSPHQRHASIVQMLRWRWALVKNLAILLIRRRLMTLDGNAD